MSSTSTTQKLIQPAGKLKAEVETNQAKDKLKTLLADVPNIGSKKFDLDFLRYVVALAKEVIGGKKIDVKAIVLDVVTTLIPHGAEELSTLESHIAFLTENKLVPKVKLSSRLITGITSWVEKKLL